MSKRDGFGVLRPSGRLIMINRAASNIGTEHPVPHTHALLLPAIPTARAIALELALSTHRPLEHAIYRPHTSQVQETSFSC